MSSVQPNPDTITITEYHYLDVASCGANLDCYVTGAAREGPYPGVISAIRTAMKKLEMPGDALSITTLKRNNEAFGCLATTIVTIALFSWFVAVNNGYSSTYVLPVLLAIASLATLIAWIFGRKSQCSFSIRCIDNENVSRIHTLLATEFSTVVILSTSWRYDVKSEALAEWSEKCIQRANLRSARVALALGVEILGVFSYEEVHELPKRNYTSPSEAGPIKSSARRASVNRESIEHTFAGTERAGAHVRIQYRVTKAEIPSAKA